MNIHIAFSEAAEVSGRVIGVLITALPYGAVLSDFESADLVMVDTRHQLMHFYRDDKRFVVLGTDLVENLPPNVTFVCYMKPLKEILLGVKDELNAKAKIPSSTEEQPQLTGEYDLLVVDDKAENREIARRVLAPHACAITLVASYGEAMRRLERDIGYHAVLTDLYMRPDAYHEAFGGSADFESQVPYGLLLAFEAAKRGLPVAVVTDANHHRDPISAAFDSLGPYEVHGRKVLFVNCKNWVAALRNLLNLE